MKKFFIAITVIGISLLISGCSLIPGASTTNKAPVKADGGIFKSVDFGDHWTAVNTVTASEGQQATNLTNTEALFIAFDPTEKDTLYYSAKSVGVFISTDDGETWAKTTLKNASYPSLSIDTRNTNVFYAIKGKTIIKSVNDMQKWFNTYVETRPSQALVDVVVDPLHPNIVYAASTTSVLKSTNYGNDWDLTDWKDPTIKRLYHSTSSSQTLYAITTKGIYKTTDGALTWSSLAESLKQYSGSSTIYWSSYDPTNDSMVVSTKYGVLRTTDGGATWSEISTLFEHKKITIKPVIANPNDQSTVLMAIKSVIQKTYDNGITWSSLKSVPTTRRIHYLVNDPNHPDTVFAGTMIPT